MVRWSVTRSSRSSGRPRRPKRALSADESAGLLRTFHVGADGHTYAEGIDLVTRVLLQSPGFLYLTEIGDVGAGPSFVMAAGEIASSLSYLLTAGPPDDALRDVAASGALVLVGAGAVLVARRRQSPSTSD